MRRFLFSAALLLLPSLAAAGGTEISREIGTKGLKATAERLAALPSPGGEERFALAGLRFLGAIEEALQLRWQTGLRADWSELPIFRLPIPENPSPRPLTGQDVTAMLTNVTAGMENARKALEPLGEADVGLEIDLSDLWFDINMNGQRDAGEEVVEVAGLSLGLGRFGVPEPGASIVRFDGSDAAWLSAYSHLLSGLAKIALAYDPAPAVDQVLNATNEMHALWGDTPPDNAFDMMFGRQVDRVAIILDMLAQEPDSSITREAHGHLLAMITENRRFWRLVEAETDNDREWVPNEKQTSALGLTLPEGTGARWQAVLADGEKLLDGELLIPHWRYGAEAGINLKTLFEAPPRVDLVGMVQGRALLPYAQKGAQISTRSWRDFESLVGGDAVLFAVFFN